MIPETIRALDRPHPKVITLYVINALLASVTTCGLALPFVLLGMVPLFIRYSTTRYHIDEEGVGLSWGWLSRQESHITFDKIQDIHLNRGLVERWLGLGTVRIQTASGNMSAEVTLFGLTAFEELRDYLYDHMRTRQRGDSSAAVPQLSAGTDGGSADDAEVLEVLRALRDEVRALRAGLSR